MTMQPVCIHEILVRAGNAQQRAVLGRTACQSLYLPILCTSQCPHPRGYPGKGRKSAGEMTKTDSFCATVNVR